MKSIFANRADQSQRHGSNVARVRRSLLAMSISAALLPSWASAATAPPLGSAAAFGVLAASAVASTGPSNVTGDVGVSPGSAIDGFPPGTASGSFYSGIASPAGTAQADALTAYNNAAGLVCDTNMTGVDLGGKTLLPGVYCFNTSADVTGILTLDLNNDPDGVFIFQIGSTLTTSANSAVQVINGSAACGNIIWKVGSSATLGIASQFKGNILALASVTLTTGANNNGGLYGLTGGVTLDTSAVQACGLPPPVCLTDLECIDDGNICTDEACDPMSPDADSFGCTHPNNTAPCDDNQFCNGEDICANGLCGHSGDPCLGGGACGDSCNEEADNCFVLAGTECRPVNGVCDTPESCTGLSADCPIDGFLSSFTQCRGSNGVCDPTENCTGLSADCPINAFLSSDTECRAANGVCDAAENCTGVSADCPIDAFLSSAVECRAANGVCDAAENCTGSSGECPLDVFSSSSTQCRGASDLCDAVENCTGLSSECPIDVFLAASTQCRGSVGDCDVTETCTGSSAACPIDGFLSSSTQCRDSAGVCDVAETCTGSSAFCPIDLAAGAGTQCRASAGDCDVAETCTGSTPLCPSDGFVSSSVQCRASAGECDLAENCTGSSVSCPIDLGASAGTLCRASAGECDVAETCTGSTPSCPINGFASSSTQCRGSAGECDVAETCTGSTPSCPIDLVVGAGTLCRASAGECDLAETCTGSTASCPIDGFLSSSTQCRGSAGECDVAETCTGSSASCPIDGFASSSTQCRASAGQCDVAESCTGVAASCPVDGFLSTLAECRASTGVCDVAESCTGLAASCPADGFLGSSTQCRASAGVCDVAETCTGSSGACPTDAFRASGFACTSDADVCTDDVCNGSGACVHNDNTAGCDDGAFCTVNDTCSNGDCIGSSRNCGDGVGCTTDACNEQLNECTHGANNAFCSDGLYCNGVETCNVQTGCVDGAPVVCGDNVGCTVDSCNEAADSCQSVPDDARCNDADHCTIDTCDAQTGCDHLFSCRDICRPAGFYAKRGGGDGPDIVQEILDATGGLDVCGQTLTETSNVDSPYLEGLGLDSALEGLCVRARDVEERSLYQALVATALNCAMSGSDSCDAVVSPFIDVSFSECDALCASGASTALTERCIDGLQCYNNGGRMIRGKCALGECNFSGKSCGADYGFCPPLTVKLVTYLQSCERFAGNCRNGDFCQPTLDVCPARMPSTGKEACKEAKTNTCTIDSCQ